MSRTERTTRLVARIAVTDSKGNTHTVEEHGDFIRSQYLDLTWSQWNRAGGKYLLKGMHVNPTDDDAVLEIAATGELLNIIQPAE